MWSLIRKHLPFVLISVTAGILLAVCISWLLQIDRSSNFVQHSSSRPSSYADAVNKTQASVVNIYTSKFTLERRLTRINDDFWAHIRGGRYELKTYKKRQNSLGSGVIIDAKGFILTNHHVIDGADEISVVLSSGRVLKAKVIGSDPDTDLAILHTGFDDLPPISIGKISNIRVGDVVLAIGNPFGVGQTVTMGIIGATGRSKLGISTFENFIQTDAAINPGNSGGALVNANGDLIGINTAIYSKTGGSQGIGFAIPINIAQDVMQQILENGRVVRGWLGLAGESMTVDLARSYGLSNVSGVLITSVLENGPADRSGVEPGDIVTHINKQPILHSEQILGIISALPPGELATIKLVRGTQIFIAKVIVRQRPLRQK